VLRFAHAGPRVDIGAWWDQVLTHLIIQSRIASSGDAQLLCVTRFKLESSRRDPSGWFRPWVGPHLNHFLLGNGPLHLLFSPRWPFSGTTKMQEELPPYDDQSSPLPRYIAAGGLTSPIDTVSLLSGASQAGEYNYKSDHLHINLGPRRWGAKFPVYGFQDVIQGTVEVAKKCSHVVSVTATVSPLVSITYATRRLMR